MRDFLHTFYARFSAVFLLLLLLLGVVLIFISVRSSMSFVRETDQHVNKKLARDLASEFRPFLRDSIDFDGIEHTIHHLMVMNPRVEIYLLDETGEVLAFFSDTGDSLAVKTVDLQPIKAFLNETRKLPIPGDDPRHAGRTKPFSVASVAIGDEIDGYLYVILGGERFDSASAMIQESYIFKATAITLAVTFGFTGIIGLALFALLTRRFNRMTTTVRQFSHGEYDKRIAITTDDEIGKLGEAFNQMADTIVANMDEMKRTDKLRRELIANISHDLRSPLASIQGYLETILMKDGDLSAAGRREYIEMIHDNTVTLGRLVGELFELSKLDSRQNEPMLETFSMAELAQDVVMKFQPQAQEMGIELLAVLPDNLAMVHADIAMIERVLSNIIENALKFTPRAGTVKVSVQRTEHEIQVEVSDTGCGIPSDEIALVFERFYRVEKSRSRKSGGTGLGLAIAHRILELHGRTIQVRSRLNEGSTFVFSLSAN